MKTEFKVNIMPNISIAVVLAFFAVISCFNLHSFKYNGQHKILAGGLILCSILFIVIAMLRVKTFTITDTHLIVRPIGKAIKVISLALIQEIHGHRYSTPHYSRGWEGRRGVASQLTNIEFLMQNGDLYYFDNNEINDLKEFVDSINAKRELLLT